MNKKQYYLRVEVVESVTHALHIGPHGVRISLVLRCLHVLTHRPRLELLHLEIE